MTQNQKNGRIVNIRFVCIISDYAERNLIIEIMDMVRVRCPGLVISEIPEVVADWLRISFTVSRYRSSSLY